MRRWSLAPVAMLLALLGASPEGARASGPDRGTLRLPSSRELEVLVVEGAASGSGAHTLGWLYYDELVTRGYVDVRDPADPADDVLVDADGNGVADFHDDLFNLNPERPYVGEGSRCLPEQTFFHTLPDGRVARFRAPELLTGACAQGPDYEPGVGPRRWPVGDWSLPSHPGGAVVGRTPSAEPGLLVGPGASSVERFSDRGLFPRVPNLLEPADPLNGGQGLGHLVAPRAVDGQGRLLPGSDPTVDSGEAGRRLRLGRIDANREVVFFLVAQGTQRPGMSADACLVPYRGPSGWMECSLWAHGDTQVYFSKTLLNLDLHQLPDERLATKNLGTEWLSAAGYRRLGSAAYGGIVVEQTVQEVRSQGERSPHVILRSPRSRPDVVLLGFEDSSAGGDRSFNDAVFLIEGLGPAATLVTIETDPNPSQPGAFVKVTVRVTTPEGAPVSDGDISVYIDGVFQASLSLASDGTASISFTLRAGTHVITAEYSGVEGKYEPGVSDDYYQEVGSSDGGSGDGGSSDSGVDAGSPDGGRPDSGTGDGGSDAGTDAGSPDGGRPDSGTVDGGFDGGSDAGTADAGIDGGTDAGTPDGGSPDGGKPDAGPVDAGTSDGGSDAGTGDAGSTDAGTSDAGTGDAGTVDGGSGDAGSTDAGTVDGGSGDAGSTDAGTDGGVPGGDAGSADGGAGENDGGVPGADAGSDDAGSDAGASDGGEDPDAGSPDAGTQGDAGVDSPDDEPGLPRDLTVTGWGCAASDPNGIPLGWLGASLGLMLRLWRRRSGG
ncbi:hypothetical protein LY474_19650 [Myxococcus stipitatus]|uniref:Ig-like domain-containing protein n=1 Tax=Myxococcus stipitatus TaxID=83455 RepID=UPI001F42ADA8|nr:Ig-like domain-containing protein [Myxococcus stipitatus]MCE9670017.1 hypothetical protein [Myxococcus stipitatus]